jgi:ABC-type Zn uptake system ZnuABC Zn-binding protein ZnuA
MMKLWKWLVTACILLLVVTGGCDKTGGLHGEEGGTDAALPQFTAVPLDAGEKLNVVATTSIVADVVKQVGGDEINLKALIPLGADPHAFEPTPQDITLVANAHVIFSNGLGLEVFLDDLIANAGKQSSLVPVSYNIHPLENTHEDSEYEEDEDGHEDVDPHTWFDPNNVIVWAQNIKTTL